MYAENREDDSKYYPCVLCKQCAMVFRGGSDAKESACSAAGPGLIPGSGRSPGERNGYPLQYSCLENPMDRGAWRATVHGVAKESDTTEQLTHTAVCQCLFLLTSNLI